MKLSFLYRTDREMVLLSDSANKIRNCSFVYYLEAYIYDTQRLLAQFNPVAYFGAIEGFFWLPPPVCTTDFFHCSLEVAVYADLV